MLCTWVDIRYDMDILDALVDEELENIDDVSEIDIDVYYYNCEK